MVYNINEMFNNERLDPEAGIPDYISLSPQTEEMLGSLITMNRELEKEDLLNRIVRTLFRIGSYLAIQDGIKEILLEKIINFACPFRK